VVDDGEGHLGGIGGIVERGEGTSSHGTMESTVT
jgi:hypothetical protein